MEGFDIRYTEEDDLSHLMRWLVDPKERTFYPFETDQEMEETLKNWIQYAKFKAALTGVVEGEPCALGILFLMPYKKVAHHATFTLFVDPSKRGRGIGKSMVKNLSHLGATKFRLHMLHIDVLSPSPLISFYNQCGFHEIIRQRQFLSMEGVPYDRVVLQKGLL